MTNNGNFGSYMIHRIRDFLLNNPNYYSIEAEVAEICTRFNEKCPKESKIVYLEELKQKVSKIHPNTSFIDEEIESLNLIDILSQSEKADAEIDSQHYDNFLKLNYEKGIIATHKPFSYEQIQKINTAVFRQSKKLVFIVTKEKLIAGRITAEVYDSKKSITLAKYFESNDKQPSLVSFIGNESKRQNAREELTEQFWVYNFKVQDSEYLLLSLERLKLAKYIINGMVVRSRDKIAMSDSFNMEGKINLLFAVTCVPEVAAVKTENELKKMRTEFDLTSEELRNGIFTLPDNSLLQYPEWVKDLFWSWLLHSPKGRGQKYPFHVLIQGPAATGKSTLFETLHRVSGEDQPIFSGSNSTLKNLLPSFRGTLPKAGYLLSSKTFAYVDEFFRCLNQSNLQETRNEILGNMNDMLEHKMREFGSGNSSIKNTKMTARVLFGTNPVRGAKSILDLIKNQDTAFLSRLVIIIQRENSEWVKLVEKTTKKSSNYIKFKKEINYEQIFSCIEYFHKLDAEYNTEEIEEIHDKFRDIMSDDLLNHYNARQNHHMECILDGIIKTRNFLENTSEYVAKKEDYNKLEKIWREIIKSWIDSAEIKKLAPNERRYWMPEKAQYMYRILSRHDHIMQRSEFEFECLKELNKQEFILNYTILKDNDIIGQTDKGEVATFNYFETKKVNSI